MDRTTIDTYNLLAKEYDEETAGFWKSFPQAFIDAFAGEVPNGRVLNVGSGPGRDGVMLQAKGLDVLCLDASSAMVELSTERGLPSMLGDFMELPFDAGSFEGVWAYTSLLHIPKAESSRALAEIQRVLTPGGVLGLGLIEGNAEEYKESSGMNQPRLFSYYTKEEIETLLQASGFEPFYFDTFQPKSKKYLHFLARRL